MTIELRKFISQALIEIAGGVHDAQAPVDAMRGQVAPREIDNSGNDRVKSAHLFSLNRLVQLVELDVAVTVADETGTKGGLNVLSAVVSIGGGASTKDLSQVVNRIQFTIPMVLPAPEER